ncbi:Iron-containing redox enzyme [Raineyella antarctica]|uniref:Iron-containing redox enzyme n=1 Tax=Raineyella antarctica TaxID=1577474 RepID=A0A1G6GL71_9ACTN|nr:iron-containing redox enzyme family protein [Raineyella antarctica]SDB82737.1 Iron-containing redox enzyme [Raineyella antarctica]
MATHIALEAQSQRSGPVPGLPATGRGPLSGALLQVLGPGRADPTGFEALAAACRDLEPSPSVLHDDDLQLTLFLLYALAYGSLGPSSDALEWDLGLLRVRQHLETLHEAELRRRVLNGPLPQPAPDMRGVAEALFELTAADQGPGLSHYALRHASAGQLRELLVLRSVYTLREADPHSWALPRLAGPAKAALVEIQSDEYGGGRFDRMHSTLYAAAMRGAGLPDGQLDHLDVVPALTLATHNTMSLFGLNRRLLGALVGHLAAFEMTSSLPNARYRDAYTRAGFGADVTAYFTEHVQADAVHEQVAAYDLAGGLAQAEPARVPDIMFGAAASLLMDGLVAAHVLTRWEAGDSALRKPVDVAA